MKASMLPVCAILALLAAGTACVAWANGSPAKASDFRVEVGTLEVMAFVEKISAPGFPNTSMNPFRRMPIHRFSVGRDGRAYVLELPGAGGGRRIEAFNMLYRLVDAPEPAILLPLGGFSLLTADARGVKVQALGAMDHSGPILQWLDGDAGQPGPEFSPGLALRTPADIDLRGGRWLLLNRTTVLDVASLRHYPAQPWILSGSAAPMAGLNASTHAAIAFSPDRNQYVLPGEGRYDVPEGGYADALLVVDIPGGRSYGVDIPESLRTGPIGDVATARWIEQHFQWIDSGTGSRLVPRSR